MRHRWVLPALAILFFLFAGAATGPLGGKIAGVQENDSAAYLPATAESTEALHAAERFAGEESTTAVVLYQRDGGLTPADTGRIEADIRSIADHFGPALLVPPPPPVISEDKQAAEVFVQLRGSDSTAVKDAVEWMRALNPDAHVTGPAGTVTDLVIAFGKINGILLGITLLVVLIILVIVYRSPLLPLLVLFSVFTSVGITTGLVYLLAKADIVTLSGQTQGILDVLVIGAGTDYALLLVARYREELRRQQDKYAAMRTAWRASAPAIVASAATVILGVICLLLSDLAANRGLGPIAAVGIACALVTMLTLLPALLVLCGRAAFWPFRPRYAAEPAEQRGIWQRISMFVGRRRRAVWAVATLVLAALSIGMVQLDTGGIPQSGQFLVTVDSKTGQELLARHFPAGSGTPATIITSAGSADAVRAAAGTVAGIASVEPYRDAGATGGTAPKVVDGTVRLDATLAAAPDSPEATDTVRRLRTAVAAVPGAGAKVGGATAIAIDTQDTARRDQKVIIPVVLIVVFAVLVLLLRALVAPLLLIATVALSFLATLGVSGLVFTHVFGFAGADASFPLFAFVFLVALGVDYNIFLMTRTREEVRHRGHEKGVLHALSVTGGVITSAGVVLAVTFAALAVIPLVALAEVAFAVAFGVLLDTLLVRSLLVPALTLDIGPATWWPSALARRGRVPEQPAPADAATTPFVSEGKR